MQALLLTAILPLTKTCLAQLKSCYSDNYVARGQTSDIPCDPSANVSACCAVGLICATNFYCQGLDGFKRMGSCTDKTGRDPACPLPLLQEPGAVNYFEYKANTTNCTNGVFCPNPGNWNCCLDGQGVREITFHNSATIPTVAAELSTYYEEGNYTIPNLTSGSLTSTTTLPRSTFASTTSTITSATPLLRASSAQSTASATSEPTPASTTANSLSSGGKAGVAIAAGGCAGIIGLLLYLLRQSRKKRLIQPGFETKGLRYEVSEMPGHDARTEMDAVEGRFPQESRPGGIKELMGQEESDRRAEMPT